VESFIWLIIMCFYMVIFQDYINDIMNDSVKSKYCRQRLLCRTLAGNLIYLLTITSPPTSDASDDIKVGSLLVAVYNFCDEL
jgi:hypothetical protein